MEEDSVIEMAPNERRKNRIVYLDSSTLLVEGLAQNLSGDQRQSTFPHTVVEMDQFKMYLPFVTEDPSLPTGSQSSATRLFGLLVSQDVRDALIGDLEERYGMIFKSRGVHAATRWFWQEVIHSFFSLAFDALKRLSGIENLVERYRRIGS